MWRACSVKETIDIIMDKMYHQDGISPPKVKEKHMRELLEMCTMETPFYAPNGQLYQQIDGVSMGSPLGPMFANFYMSEIEERSKEMIKEMKIYCRYVDDIFIVASKYDDIEKMRRVLKNNSVLNFTKEIGLDNKLPFLDILLEKRGEGLFKSVYAKTTDKGRCLNATSECPDRYKRSVYKYYIMRAFKYSSDYERLHIELERVKKMLVNNGYLNSDIDKEIKRWFEKSINEENEKERKGDINIYYRNYMSTAYKTDEKVIKDIIRKNVKTKDSNKKLNLIIYYQNSKVKNMVMTNNRSPKLTDMQKYNVNYKFECKVGNCEARVPKVVYIGMTQTRLTRRITMHMQTMSSAIMKHYIDEHDRKPMRKEIVDSTKVVKRYDNYQRLSISEALLIKRENPILNRQDMDYSKVLKLF